MKINIQIDFNKWIKEAISSTRLENNEIYFTNQFADISLFGLSNENISENFIYDESEQLIIIVRGKIILSSPANEFSKNKLYYLIDLYKKRGKDFLKDINGSFNVILINIKTKEVFICNDQVGVLRIYYEFEKNKLLISTDISFLLNNEQLDEKGLIQFGLLNYYYDDSTIFKNIKWVLPGNLVRIKDDANEIYNYFNFFNHVLNLKNGKSKSLHETAASLQSITHDYFDESQACLTLTSGFDSRLLFATVNESTDQISAFTFGQPENIEFSIADKVLSEKNKEIYYKIILDEEFEEFLNSYPDYIYQTKNLELNFNRYHYVYIWKKLKELGVSSNILTGLCGDSFLRDGLTVSYQINELLYNLIYTKDKIKTIHDFLDKKSYFILSLELNRSVVEDYLINIFSPLKNNNVYFNHFFIKINFGIQKYFATELNTENLILNTFSPFLDIRYIDMLILTGYSNVTNDFLNRKFRYQNISHKVYASLIKSLNERLIYIPTNRGYPLSNALYIKDLPVKLVKYYLYKKKKKINDLNYQTWRSNSNLKLIEGMNFDDSIKIQILKNIV